MKNTKVSKVMLSIVLTVVFFFGCESLAFTDSPQETQVEKKETQIDLPSSALNPIFINKQEQLEDFEEKLAEIEESKRVELEKARLAEEARLAHLAKIEAERKAKEVAEQKRQAELAQKKQQESKGIAFNGSYYTAKCKGCSGITATGVDVRKTIYYKGMRIIAVDPSVIPLYSIVQVTTPYETFKAIALDKGGAIKGHKVDILVGSKELAYELGRHTVYVKVIRHGKGE